MRYINSFLILFFPVFVCAQIPNIAVKDMKSHPVSISAISIETKIFGNLATTTATYVFSNSSDRDLEGVLTFPLPDGVSVSGYALDIKSKMRTAVPVPKEKAKEVFENISGRNIDPGIIEKVAGNNFRTRVYPIPASGNRTVQISFQQELKSIDNQNQFIFSFAGATKFKNFKLKVSLFEAESKPEIIENSDGSFTFEKKDNLWEAEINKTDFIPNQNLIINIPKNQNSKVILQPRNDNKYFFAAQIATNLKTSQKPKSSVIAIIWDSSLSGANRNFEKEFEFLDTFFKDNRTVEVQLNLINITIENGGIFNIKDGNWQDLRNYLINIKYDGATDFSLLKEILNVQEYLLFSDGISNFGDLSMSFTKPLSTICSTPTADFGLLKNLAHQSGGSFINLNEQSADEGFRNYKKQPLKLISLKGQSVEEVYPKIGTVVDSQFTLFGISPSNSGQLIAVFESNNQQFEIVIDFNTTIPQNNWDISKNWAQRKIDFLEISPTINSKSIREMSQSFGIVSKNTSLIVLENVEDYIKFKIAPPKELEVEYNNAIAQNKKQTLVQRRQLLSKAFDKTKELQAWWSMEFEKKAAQKKATIVNQSTVSKSVLSDEVMVINDYKSKDVENRKTQTGGKINLVEVESNEAYMMDFKNLESSDLIYQKYVELRPKYTYYVPFYFDISKMLYKKDKNRSLKVLSTLAELDIENEELYKTIYYLLKQRGYVEKQLWVAQKILEWRPFDAQSHRDCALAFLDNKKLQEALDIYKSLLYQEFTDEISIRDEGIEEILIMEINNILNANKTVDASKIDNRLKANLPVDVRVVISWNKDHTDIDLHIEDPNGEECFYSNNRTSTGGRLSNDFTDGFGPEQFLLKKATKGKYKIKTNYFGDRQLKLSGPTTIMAEVFLYYSDGRQERKIAVFQLQNSVKTDKDGKIVIGEFTF